MSKNAIISQKEQKSSRTLLSLFKLLIFKNQIYLWW